MKIDKGHRVRVKVHLKIKGGDDIEKSVVEYFHGGGTMLPGLEKALAGLKPGDKKSGTIPSADAFGGQSHAKSVSRDEFPKGAEFEKGARFMAKGQDGQDVVLQIEGSNSTTVDVLYLHPLHDADIDFDVEVLSVSDPAPPPLPASAVTEE